MTKQLAGDYDSVVLEAGRSTGLKRSVMDLTFLWETITIDIPKLKCYCSSILQQFDVLMQESINEPEDEQ